MEAAAEPVAATAEPHSTEALHAPPGLSVPPAAPATRRPIDLELERLRREIADAWETVRDLSAALSTAVDENRRLRRLLPHHPPPLPRPPAIRLRSR